MKTTITHTFELEDKDSCEGCGCLQWHERLSGWTCPLYEDIGTNIVNSSDYFEEGATIRPDICKEDQERQTNEKDN